MQPKPGNNSKQATTRRPAPSGARIRSLIRKNLVANPDFPRIYAEVLESEGHNFNEAKDLAIQLQKKLGVYKPEKRVQTCAHIMVTGVPCGSPALRGEQFCYFHQRMLQGVALPRTQLSHVALLENEEAIQVSLMQVMNGLMSGSIDLRRGELILRALNTAVRNSRRARFNIHADKMVTDVPHYEQDAASRERSREEVRAEIHRMRTEAAQQLAEKTGAENPHPPANSAGRMGQPAQSPDAIATPAQNPPAKSATAPDVTQRKPPLSINASAEVRGRKTAALAGNS
jgi:hypothetical protein